MLVEGVLEESEAAPGARRDGIPAELPLMQEVDLERPGDVVHAVAVVGIGSTPDRVLHDADLVGEDVQMDATDRMERCLKH